MCSILSANRGRKERSESGQKRNRDKETWSGIFSRGGPRPSYRCDRIKAERAHHQGEMYVRPGDPTAAGTVDLHR